MRNIFAKRNLLIGILIGQSLFFFPVSTFSQLRNAGFERISTENGLSSNRVFKILQDREGFYWITTEDGLNRFDGSSFKIFRNVKGDSNSISHNMCNHLLEGDDGDIWIATMRGVCRYIKKKGIFRRYTLYHPEKNEDILNRISGLAKDDAGNIWVTSYGLWKINPVENSVKAYWHSNTDITSLSEASQTDNLSLDKINHGLWLNTSESINFFDFKSGSFFHSRHNPESLPIFRVQSEEFSYEADATGYKYFYYPSEQKLYRFRSYKDKYDSITLSFQHTVYGLSTYDDGQLLFRFQSFPSVLYGWGTGVTDTMPYSRHAGATPYSAIVKKVYLDLAGNKWFCTGDGLYVWRKPANLVQKFVLDDRQNVFPYVIWSIAPAANNAFWLGTKTGLYRYEMERQKLTHKYPTLFREPIRTLYNDGDSILWVGCNPGKLFLIDLKTNRVRRELELESNAYFIVADKYNHIWVGTWVRGIYELDKKGHILNHFTTDDGLAYNGLLSAWYDGGDELWLGLNGGKGYASLNVKTKGFSNYAINCERNTSIESNTVNAVVKDSAGNLWLGTYGGGLFYYDNRQKQYGNYSRSDGLSGDFINSLTMDNSGNLWVCTSRGIDIIEARTGSIVRIYDDMQFEDQGYVNNLLVGKDGNFYYTQNNTVLSINPAKYSSTNREVKLIRSSFKIMNEEVPALINASAISLPHDRNFFTIEYSVLKESPSIPAQYAYKMEGLDADWKYIGNRGYVNYTSIPPGKYTLLMNATNEYGKWNSKPLSLTITIDPPFWKTWWFFAILALVISSIAAYIIQSRIRQIKKRQREIVRLVVATQEKEQKNIAGELHDHLGVRLSALKFFLTSLKNYLSPDKYQVQETYQKAMATIDESVEDVRYLLINLSPKTLNEYGYLKAVEDLVNKLGKLHAINISLQQNGLEDRLHAEIEAGLYRITQELINNTLKHANAKNILLRIEQKNGMVKLSYEDDGIGFNPYSKSNGYGLENIHTRVALLNGKIEWNSHPGKFSRVAISIPSIHTKG